MSLVNVASLDFNDIRESIKSFLRADGRFTDYDFEGSNFSILIDTLAYNTYISSYNANMLTNEVFLDGATLRENVVSLARNLGYLPRSTRASRAKITFFINVSGYATNPISITLRKGIVATSSASFSNLNYIYSIPDDITVPVSNGVAIFNDIEIFEGSYIEDNFTVSSLNKNQKFILNNENVDTSLIRVTVRESKNSNISRTYKFADNLTAVKPTDDVFFLNEIADQRYELIFGDNTFGSKLQNDNFIMVSYVTTNGSVANGIDAFSFAGRLIDNNGSPVVVDEPVLTTVEAAGYGADIESIASIKKLAPRVYSSQNRAVTASDYESLIPLIYPETESVSVFGGEELDPPKFGKVYITVKPKNGSYLPTAIKDNLKITLRKYAVAGIVPEFIDLKYLYIEYNSKVYYNSNRGNPDFIKNQVGQTLEKFAKSDELNRYGSRFKYSKFLKLIDDSSIAITSNITTLQIRRDLKVRLKQFTEYEICFGNQFHIKNPSGYNFKTSGFSVDGITGTVYLSDLPHAEGFGTVFLFKLDASNQPVVVRKKVGTIDYNKGEIKLNALNIISTSKKSFGDDIIEFSAIPKSNDVIGKQDLYLQLDNSKSMVNMVNDVISSGIDISGSQYIVSSSYLNGEFIRL